MHECLSHEERETLRALRIILLGGTVRHTLNAGIAFVTIQKEIPVQTLDPHKSLNTNHAVLLVTLTAADGSAVPLSSVAPPASSDPSQSTAEARADGTGYNLTTPLESGAVHYTFAPAGFDGVEFDFSYAPAPVGHVAASFGPDEADA